MADPGDEFELPSGIYALSHSVGCLPKSAKAALEESYFQPWRDKGGAAWDDWLGATARFREALAGLLGGAADDYCPQPSVSDGFYNVLTAVPRRAKTRVLMHRDAFPSLGFVVHGLVAQGFELVLADGDATDLSTWQATLDGTIDVVLVTHAHSNTGKLSPVAAIAELCRARGMTCVVDVAQSAGVIPIRLDEWKADAVVGSCVKWLCGGPGAGFLWVDAALLGKLQPTRLGWFSHANPFEFDITDFRPAPTADRFWGGTPGIAPYVLAAAGVDEISRVGIETIRAHNLSLMAACLEAAGKDPASLDAATNTGTLCFDLPGTAEDAAARLSGIDCHHDRRGSALRISFHIYNTEDEARRVGHALAPALNR